MKRNLLYLLAISVLASCSAPKYTYNFDHYNYSAGKKKTTEMKEEVATNPGPEAIQPEELIASTEKEVVVLSESQIAEKTLPAPVRKTYVQMDKSERKALRNHLKSEIKALTKSKKDGVEHVSAAQAMDKDLKLAAVFGAVGVVAMIIGGDVFWIIGGIALLIGVVFFVKWLVRQ